VSIGGYLPVEKVYAYEPIPPQLSDEQAKHILGAQANVWSEYMTNAAKLEYMIFPRLTALSEVLWSNKENRNWKDFSKRLQVQFRRYERWKVNYSKAYFDIQASILPAPDRQGVLWKLGTNLEPESSLILVKLFDENGNRMIVTGNKSKEVNPPIPVTVSSTYEGTLFQVITKSAHQTKELSHVKQHFSLNKATGKNITLTNIPLDNFPGNGGAFGLVNGAVSDRGLSSYEWLGWQDTDMEAIIDLDKKESISKLTVHTLDQRQGRFSNPSYVEVFSSDDGKSFKSLGKSELFVRSTLNMGNITVEFPGTTARYVKVIAKNPGIIPAGEPYAGSRARILIDEIAID
jgi:hexosaminidase